MNVKMSSCKVPVILADFNEIWYLGFFPPPPQKYVEKIQVGIELFHADGQTNMTALVVAKIRF
jgi:hypothetical protein